MSPGLLVFVLITDNVWLQPQAGGVNRRDSAAAGPDSPRFGGAKGKTGHREFGWDQHSRLFLRFYLTYSLYLHFFICLLVMRRSS
jgi:hypothetical protein